MLKFKWETEFKETEIGEIPKDWEVRKIEEIANVSTGGTPSRKNEEYWGGDINWVKSQEVRKYFIWETEEKITEKGMRKSNAKRIYLPNTVLIALYGATAGEAALLKVPATVNQAIAALEGHKTNNLFLFYLLLANKERLKDISIGSAQQNLYLKDIKNFEVALPPANDEQSRIATVLSWFDDLIENKKRQNEILEKVAMAIFKSWFVDFEPFKDEEFVYNEELGKEIPKGWEVKKLGEFVSTQYGFTASGEETGKIKLLRIKDINKAFVIDWDSVPFCNITNDIFPKYRLKNMDIVISRIGDIGKVAIVENPPLSVFASYLIRLKIKNHKLTPYYLYYWLKAPDYQEYIQGAAEGSTRPNTNAEVIKAGPILIPPSSLIEKFEEVVHPIRSKIILNQKQIMVLRKIRDALLPKLVFGKLRVEEI